MGGGELIAAFLFFEAASTSLRFCFTTAWGIPIDSRKSGSLMIMLKMFWSKPKRMPAMAPTKTAKTTRPVSLCFLPLAKVSCTEARDPSDREDTMSRAFILRSEGGRFLSLLLLSLVVADIVVTVSSSWLSSFVDWCSRSYGIVDALVAPFPLSMAGGVTGRSFAISLGKAPNPFGS